MTTFQDVAAANATASATAVVGVYTSLHTTEFGGGHDAGHPLGLGRPDDDEERLVAALCVGRVGGPPLARWTLLALMPSVASCHDGVHL